MKPRYFLWTLLAVVFLACPNAFAEGIVGRDQAISVNTVQFLMPTGEDAPYVQVFNYFFTIELLTGVIGAFLYQVIKVFRM